MIDLSKRDDLVIDWDKQRLIIGGVFPHSKERIAAYEVFPPAASLIHAALFGVRPCDAVAWMGWGLENAFGPPLPVIEKGFCMAGHLLEWRDPRGTCPVCPGANHIHAAWVEDIPSAKSDIPFVDVMTLTDREMFKELERGAVELKKDT